MSKFQLTNDIHDNINITIFIKMETVSGILPLLLLCCYCADNGVRAYNSRLMGQMRDEMIIMEGKNVAASEMKMGKDNTTLHKLMEVHSTIPSYKYNSRR